MKILLIFIAFLALCLSGCVTTQQKQVKEQQRRQWESRVSKASLEQDRKINDLQRAIDEIKQAQANFRDRLADLEKGLARSASKRQGGFNALRAEIQALGSSTEKKINAILEEVGRENERLLKQIGRRGKSAYMQGYEHVVQAGDTLSSIAHQYKVRVRAIVDANQIEDPNSLRVGQKLFIPQ